MTSGPAFRHIAANGTGAPGPTALRLHTEESPLQPPVTLLAERHARLAKEAEKRQKQLQWEQELAIARNNMSGLTTLS